MADISFSSQQYEVKGIQLHVVTVGKGKDVIFIHGWSNNWFGWKRLADELAPYYRLHLIDLPGFGNSDELNEYSIPIVSEYVHEYIQQYVSQPIAIVGGSLGTFITSEVARQYQVPYKLILIGTVIKRNKIKVLANVYQKILAFSSRRRTPQFLFEHFIRHPYSAYVIERFFNAYKFDKQLVDTYQVPGRQKVNGKCYVQIGLSAIDYTIEDFLHVTTNKVLLIFGQADRYVRANEVNAILTQLDNTHLQSAMIPEAGHSPAYEQPKATAELIKDFLN